ncbi:uncharacterized protein MELLADRAFT_91778 [Melampsora larici-populina 98AG31]|uniref:Uncharacterized protein n=1 Tax=Melampsora larici-populina (strain 98AG31 / pathotype 3-4-7) TaxID=747676 RepID=F4S097_MELLP|nr:uncharacterized protein MELLADRAFT_91778 [Melampsora larici-populina 98AG31]EGG01924.1 hypothetical protein MELLADRAFT_91778 [Melampsora larici-populina 98AG31]
MFSTITQATECVTSHNSSLKLTTSDILAQPLRLSFMESHVATLTWLRTTRLSGSAQRVFSEPNADLSKRNHHPCFSRSTPFYSQHDFLSSSNSDHQSAPIKHLRVCSCPEPNIKITHLWFLTRGAYFSSVSQNDVEFQEKHGDHSSGLQGTDQLVEYVVPFPSSDLDWPSLHGIKYHPSEAEIASACSSSARSPIAILELGTPSSDTFLGSDVSFSPVQPTLNCLEGSSLVNEVVWEDRSHHRISRMIEKELRASIQNPPFESCRIASEVRQEVVNWLLQFDLHLRRYPDIPSSTRHRAITLFSAFWSQDSIPGNMLLEDIQTVARRTGVACLILACKVDIDGLQPLFNVRLEVWVNRVVTSGWVSADPQSLASDERAILRGLSYNVTAPSPFDFVSELQIASFELMRLVNHWPEDWEMIHEGFKIILERTVQTTEYIQYPTSVLTAAALFLSLEGCLFDHPFEQSVVEGRQWSRDPDGTWTESVHPNAPKTVRVHMLSEVLCEMLVEVVQEDIMASVCDLLDLDEEEVEECQNWCRSL